MALSRTRNLQDHKVPMQRFQNKAPVKRGKTEESEAPETGKGMGAARDPGTPSKDGNKAPDRTTDRGPPRAGRPPPPMRKDPADSEGRKPPGSAGGEYGDMSKGSVRGAQKGTPEQAKKLAGALGRGRRQQP